MENKCFSQYIVNLNNKINKTNGRSKKIIV